MSEPDAGATRPPDPTEKFRELRDAYLQVWSKTMIDAVNTEGYARASGAAMEGYLNISSPYKEAAEQAMLRILQQLNMPTSVDFAGLAGRFTNIEMQLDNLDAKLDKIQKLISQPQSIPLARTDDATKSSPRATPARESQEVSSEVPKQASMPRAAEKTRTPSKSKSLAAKRIPTARPLRRNPREGAK